MAKTVVADKIKQLRLASGLSQKAAGEACSMSEQMWQQYEYGTRTPGFDKLVAIADLFNVSLDFLAGRTNDPKRK